MVVVSVIVELAHPPVLSTFDLLLGLSDLTLGFGLVLRGTCSRGVLLVSDHLLRGLSLNNRLSLLGLLSLKLLVLVGIDFSCALLRVAGGHLLSHHLLKRAILSAFASSKLEDSLWLVGVAFHLVLSELVEIRF